MSAELETKVNFLELERKIMDSRKMLISISFLLPDTVPKTIISESKPSSFPSALRAKRSAIQTLTAADKRTEALTEKDCPQCGRKEMYYTTVQLRSADEGSTVFFTCVCGYKYEP